MLLAVEAAALVLAGLVAALYVGTVLAVMIGAFRR